jgi:hypoxanthine phosphoribosyltransferase
MSERINMTEGLIKHTQPTFHYLLVNVFEWRSGDDLHALMKAMDKVKYNGKALTYWVWYVPCEDKTPYEINFYQPQVEGAFILAEVNPAEKKRKVNQ